MAVDVHEEERRIGIEEMVVESSDLEAVIEEGGHNRVDFAFEERKVAHDNLVATVSLCHCDPSGKAERSREKDVLNTHFEVIAWDAHFVDIGFIITLFAE